MRIASNERTSSISKVRIVVSLLFLCAALSPFFLGDFDTSEQSSDELNSVLHPRPMTVAPGVHLLGALNPSVAYLIETSDGLVLIDAGLQAEHKLLLQQVRSLGLDIMQLRKVFITHGHGDHYLGAMKLRDLTGAEIVAGKGDSDVLQNAGPREAVFSTFLMHGVDIHATSVDRELVGGEHFRFGDIELEAISTPGHTPGSMCYVYRRANHAFLFSGDTIMTLKGDLGTYATYLSPRYRGDAEQYLSSLKKLRQMPVPDLLLPGHPFTGATALTVQLETGDWFALLDTGILEMEELVRRYAADGAGFLDGGPKAIMPDLYYLGDYQNSAVFCLASEEAGAIVFLAAAPIGIDDFLQSSLERNVVTVTARKVRSVVVTEFSSVRDQGLENLLARFDATLVTSRSCLQMVQKHCSFCTVHPVEDVLPEAGVTEVETIAVEGIAKQSFAVAFRWGRKQVLVSGHFPVKLNEQTVRDFQRVFAESKAGFESYSNSIRQLARLRPNVWLTAHPINGQNANLYGQDWSQMLRTNVISN